MISLVEMQTAAEIVSEGLLVNLAVVNLVAAAISLETKNFTGAG